MRLRYYPETDEGEERWKSALDSVELTRMELGTQLEYLFHDEAPEEVTLRLLSPGKSGARVAVASFLDHAQKSTSWVIKLVPKELLPLLQQELTSTEIHARRLFPELRIRHSIACIAMNFASVTEDLGSYLGKAHAREDVESVVEHTFSSFAPWYAEPKLTTQGFFDLHTINDDVARQLEARGDTELMALWHELEERWPLGRGVVTAMSHGDLNETNVLVRNDGTTVPIDYALTKESHWALDFTRLERQIKFSVAPDYPDTMSAIADASFDFEASLEESIPSRTLAAVAAIRHQARVFFETAVRDFGRDYPYPGFMQEYFHALAFQQLCLVGSHHWPKAPERYAQLIASTRRVLTTLVANPKKNFFFGYFAYVDDNKEHVLLREAEDGQWCFPISGFIPNQAPSVEHAIEHSVAEFVNANDARRANFLNAGFNPIDIVSINLTDQEQSRLIWDNTENFVSPHFFRVRVGEPFDPMATNYFWTSKGPEFDNITHDGKNLKCGQPELREMVRNDFVRQECDRKVLECCDILVFREKAVGEAEPEFLMLQRKDNHGWEYPKGGREYHETAHEGAIRELLEETRLGQIGDFIFGGNLGYQTADVGWRPGKAYDTLRVEGITYLFAGDDADIGLSSEHEAVKWMSLDEAKEKVWVGPYGRLFFDRWQHDRLNIQQRISRPVSIVFQLTEQCPFSCRFCLRRKAREEPMALADMKLLIDILKQRGVQRLTFSGGEPMSVGKERLLQIIRYANHLHLHTCLSTTGFGLTKSDMNILNDCLDELLLSLHSVNDEIDPALFGKASDGAQMRQQVEDLIRWLSDSPIMIEVSTVVNRVNAGEIVPIGRWLFSRSNKVRWRLEEYYANGSQGPRLRDKYELSNEAFTDVIRAIEENAILAPFLRDGSITISSKDSRTVAPDVMLTPQGNLVTSASHAYELKGGMSSLLHWDFKNRRPWSDYRKGIRDDWDW